MMRKLLTGLAIVFGSVSVGWAHHPFSSEYDANKPVTLTGTVSSVSWSDPHVHISMDAKDANGANATWTLEGASPGTLEKSGWKSTTLKQGDQITAMAYRSLDGSNTVSARTITLPNGRNMVISDAAEDGGPQPGTSTTTSALPQTASNNTLIGLLGLGAIGAALAMRRLRMN
jgi:LPXTG-motif cell wall-anchored protein